VRQDRGDAQVIEAVSAGKISRALICSGEAGVGVNGQRNTTPRDDEYLEKVTAGCVADSGPRASIGAEKGNNQGGGQDTSRSGERRGRTERNTTEDHGIDQLRAHV